MDVDSNDVVVPPTNCPLSPSEMAELRSLCNPLSTTDDLAVTMFLSVLQFTITRFS